MEKKEEAAAKFIGALIKSLQTLCHGYLDFQTGIEIIGHINLNVDKGSSLDYVLKEKVCRNAENSTLFISNSFHAEAKGEEISLRKSDGSQCTISMDQSDGGKVASSISSISSSLSGSLHKQQRGSEARDYCSSHTQYKGSSKRRSMQDQSGDHHAAKVSHMSSESSHSQCASSPTRSRVSLHGVETSDTAASETMLPQTAGVSDSSGIGVNLAGSVLEPVGSQNDSDLHHRDDDSDGDLEVTFIKEEYGHGDSGGGDFDNSGAHQFAGASAQREGSRFAGLADSGAAFLSASFDHGQQFSPDAGPSSSQPGPSGLRGVSGIQGFVNSLSAFGPLATPTLPLSQIGPGGATSRHNRIGGLPKTIGAPLSASYSKSHSSLQRAFALHREDKRKKQEGVPTSEEDLKQRLELMSELLSLKGISSTEDYKTALIREKRRLAKKLYRASLPEEKKNEIKEKDKLNKRMKRASRWAASESMTDPAQHFSDCSSDMTSHKDFDSMPPRTSSGFADSFAAVGSMSVGGSGDGGIHDKDQGAGGNDTGQSSESSRIVPRSGSGPGSEDNLRSMGSESLPCDSGVGTSVSVGRLGSDCLGNMSRICSSSAAHVQVGTDPMESFAGARPGTVSSSGLSFPSMGSLPWGDPSPFSAASQGHRHLEHDRGHRESYSIMKLSHR